MVEFWKKNLNPITMFTTAVPYSEKRGQCRVKGSWIKDSEVENHVSAVYLREEYNIGAVKLKRLFATLGDTPKFNRSSTYYSLKNLEHIKELLSCKKESVDMSMYISNQELMTMFGFNTFKAFYIADKEKLEKKRLSGNVSYYAKEKAILAFEKYKKE